jgi:hypothetical protein
MTRPTLYLSGPMSGLPDNNYPAFHAAAAQLRAAGYTVINPAELGLPPGLEWIEYMRACMIAMMLGRAEGLAMLPGWDRSQGATAENEFARRLRLHDFTVETWLRFAKELEVTP